MWELPSVEQVCHQVCLGGGERVSRGEEGDDAVLQLTAHCLQTISDNDYKMVEKCRAKILQQIYHVA